MKDFIEKIIKTMETFNADEYTLTTKKDGYKIKITFEKDEDGQVIL